VTGQAALPGLGCEADARALETDTAARSDDPTPRGVIRAVLEAWRGYITASLERAVLGLASKPVRGLASKPVRVLDVCAGYGAWASEMRRLAGRQGWPVHITGVEIFEARRPELRKWCDEVIIRDWFDALRDHHTLPEYDIAIGNPHFPALTGALTPGDDFGEFEPSMPEWLLEHAPAVLLLHTQQAFLRGAAGRAAWRRCPPAACWLVPGAVGFRGPGEGTDARCYQVTLWLRGYAGPCATHLLPELDAGARRWRVEPGSETPSTDLPAAPGWTS